MAEPQWQTLRVMCKRDLKDIAGVVQALDFGTGVEDVEKALKLLPREPGARGEPAIPSFGAERITLAAHGGQVIVQGEWSADYAELVTEALVLLANMGRQHVQLNRREWESAATALASLQR